MRIIRATLLGLFCSSIAFGQVTTMNVYQNNGVLLQVPVSAIDSVTLSTTPPPSMSIYQTGGSVSTIVLANIDSITYTVVSNPQPSGTVVDCEGNIYPTVFIGDHEWMAENLRTTCYANGDPIPNVTDDIQWGNLTTGAWCHYDNDSQYEIPYGKLYNWYTVDDSRNVCPTGWHVPTDAEWTVLTDYLGGVSVAGGKMKSTGTQYWQSPNTNATNESGFSGLPSGLRYFNGIFQQQGYGGIWWSSTENLASNAWHRDLSYSTVVVYRGNSDQLRGYSVRCIKDQ